MLTDCKGKITFKGSTRKTKTVKKAKKKSGKTSYSKTTISDGVLNIRVVGILLDDFFGGVSRKNVKKLRKYLRHKDV